MQLYMTQNDAFFADATIYDVVNSKNLNDFAELMTKLKKFKNCNSQ